MNIALQITANLAIAFEPFLPFSMEKLNKMLNVEPLGWNRLGSTDLLEAGHQLGKSELLFEKIEDSVIEAQVQKLLDTKKANEEANYKAKPIRENIEFDDFMKLDIRVGTVLELSLIHILDGTNGILSFGQPFTAKPTKLTGYYKYTPVNIDYMEQWDSKVDPDLKSGDSDQCIIYIALCTKNYEIRTNPKSRQLFDPNDASVIAYGELVAKEAVSGEEANGYKKFSIDIKYRKTDVCLLYTSRCV